MSEYDFPYLEITSSNKYNPKYIMPINLTNLTISNVNEIDSGKYQFVENKFINDEKSSHEFSNEGTENQIYEYMHNYIVDKLSEKKNSPNSGIYL